MPFYEFPASFVPHEKGFLLDFSCYYNISPLACRTPSPLDRLSFFSFDAPCCLQCKKNENSSPSLAVSDIFVAHPAAERRISAFFFWIDRVGFTVVSNSIDGQILPVLPCFLRVFSLLLPEISPISTELSTMTYLSFSVFRFPVFRNPILISLLGTSFRGYRSFFSKNLIIHY